MVWTFGMLIPPPGRDKRRLLGLWQQMGDFNLLVTGKLRYLVFVQVPELSPQLAQPQRIATIRSLLSHLLTFWRLILFLVMMRLAVAVRAQQLRLFTI